MRKAYILVYSDKLGTREEVKNCLDNIKQVNTWRFDIPNSFYIISDYSANELAEAIHEFTGKKKFLVSELTSNRQGWLSDETWYLIENKKHIPDK